MAPNFTPTPLARIVKLLEEATPLIEVAHPAFGILQEALRTAQGLDPYICKISTPIIVPATHPVPEAEVRAVWEELLDITDKNDWNALYKAGKTRYELTNGMCSGDYEASVLQTLAVTSNATSVLEIGTFTGTATLALALLPKITRVVALDIEPYLEEFDRPYWKRAGVSHKIDLRIGVAVDLIQQLKGEGSKQFDLVFIDADKPSYAIYVDLILLHDLLSPGGMILADNTLYKGYPYSPVSDGKSAMTPTALLQSNNGSHNVATQGIIDFNNKVRNDYRVNVVVLPVRDGISMITRKI